MILGRRRATAIAAAVLVACPVGCFFGGYGDDCSGALRPGTYNLDILGRVDEDAGPPCLPDLAAGMQLTLDVEELADCGRAATLQTAPSAFTFFARAEGTPDSGLLRTYNVATADGCSGLWGADIQRPPVAQSLGVPCDDCVAFERIFIPLTCPAVPAECADTFYGRLTKVP